MIKHYFRRATASFHHICGNKDSSANSCSLKVKTYQDGNETEVYTVEDSKLFNDGAMINVTEWNWEHIPLGMIKPGTQLMFHGNYDTAQGAVNMDNIHVFTRQKCIPRWSRIPFMQFQDQSDIYQYVSPSPVDLRAFEFSYLEENDMKKRYYEARSDQGVQSIEHCARLCLVSRSCDMFQVPHGSTNCKFYANSMQKFTNIYDYLKPSTSYHVYVLQCSPVSENIIVNSDHFTHTREPWVVNNTCTMLKVRDWDRNPESRHAVLGWHQLTNEIKCYQQDPSSSQNQPHLDDRPCDLQVGKQFEGSQVDTVDSIDDAETCKEKCDEHDKCGFFRWRSDENRCYRYYSMSSVNDNADSTSGYKYCGGNIKELLNIIFIIKMFDLFRGIMPSTWKES